MDKIRSKLGIFLVLSLVLGSLGLVASLALAADDNCDTPSGEELPGWPLGAEDPHHSPFGGDARGDTGTATPIPDPEHDWSGHVEGWSCDGARGENGEDPSCFEEPDLGQDDCEAGSEVFVGGNTGGANNTDDACVQASVKLSGANPDTGEDVGAEVWQKGDVVSGEQNTAPGTKERCSGRGNSNRTD